MGIGGERASGKRANNWPVQAKFNFRFVANSERENATGGYWAAVKAYRLQCSR